MHSVRSEMGWECIVFILQCRVLVHIFYLFFLRPSVSYRIAHEYSTRSDFYCAIRLFVSSELSQVLVLILSVHNQAYAHQDCRNDDLFHAGSIISMVAGITSCEEDAAEKLTIAGSWKVVKFESFVLNPEGGEMDKAEWNVSEYNFVNTFRLDGSYQYGMLRLAEEGETGDYREDLLTGNWSYKNGILTMSFNETGRVEDYELVKLDDKELVMRMTENDSADSDVNRVITTYMSRLTNFIEEELGTTN